ncbi:hypothetical protein RI065_10500 [Mycoplasmatota bacterium zrk1]
MAKYSVQFKRKILNYYEQYGQAATVKKFNVHGPTLHRWKRKSETVGFMRKKNKTYTQHEKLDILTYYWKNGISQTDLKFDINCGVIHNWERLFREYGVEGLAYDGRGRKPKDLGPKKDVNKDKDLLDEVQYLRMENLYLKKLDALVQEREERELKKKSK